jgi:hypothetical protein
MIVVLVEGDGDKKAVPILLERAKGIDRNEVHCVDMKGKSNIIRENDGFEKVLLRQIVSRGTTCYVLLDKDGPHAPYSSLTDEIQRMKERAEAFQNKYGVSVTMLWAIREFESWLVGGFRKGNTFCGLVNIKAVSNDTQSAPEDPKIWIIEHREKRRYDSNIQACLTKYFDIRLAKKRNQSLRIFLSEVRE